MMPKFPFPCSLCTEAIQYCTVSWASWVAVASTISGLPRVREKSGKLKFFQGQGIVREFCKLSGNFGNTVKCQGIVREF